MFAASRNAVTDSQPASVLMALTESALLSRSASRSSEVAIPRRYFRSGESEYLVNGKPVRLRDLSEMLMDTGLGRDGYSIISQGKICLLYTSPSPRDCS